MTKLPISVCLVAGNEAHRIRPALDSVKDWTSELIVAIDDQVTDGTDKLAAAGGAKVIRQPWRGHAAHRNFAADHARQPWLLAIDADEVVSEKLRDEIIAAFQSHGGGPLPAAYSFPRLSWFGGRWIRHGDWYPDRKVRLWRKTAGQWEGDPHEKLVLQGQVIALRADLFHYSNENIDQMLGKIQVVSSLFVAAMPGPPARRRLDRSHRAAILEILSRVRYPPGLSGWLAGVFYRVGECLRHGGPLCQGDRAGAGASGGANAQTRMKISLVINTFDQPDYLARVLAAVARQRVPPEEVLLADDGSGPPTRELFSGLVGPATIPRRAPLAAA